MSALHCVECGADRADRWWIVADRMVCEPCAASVRSTFQFTTREHIEVIAESGFSAEGLKIAGSPRAMRAVEDLVSALCDMVLSQREQVQRVRELHEPVRIDLAGAERCGYCALRPWPCETIRALDGDNSE